ncbi:MAG: mevalonate kinase [Pseudoclavibacter sp.]
MQVGDPSPSDRSSVDTPMHAGVGQTVAKIILFGEHSVVYGYPAIAMPLRNLRMIARVEPTTRPSELSSLGWVGPLDEAPARFASIVRAVDAALEFAGHPNARLRIETHAEFPPERGLGSSAAAAGAVIRAVLNAFDVDVEPEDLFDLTQVAERIAHGHPSGLDATATSSQSPIHFQAGATTAVQINLSAWIVVADSGIHGSTRETVGHIREEHERCPEVTRPRLAELGRITAEAVDDVRAGDVSGLGQKMNDAHRLLAELGVSNARLDQLTAAARSAGAVGAKLTGGGRGGCVIALARTSADAKRIAAALGMAGATGTWVYAPHAYEVAA